MHLDLANEIITQDIITQSSDQQCDSKGYTGHEAYYMKFCLHCPIKTTTKTKKRRKKKTNKASRTFLKPIQLYMTFPAFYVNSSRVRIYKESYLNLKTKSYLQRIYTPLPTLPSKGIPNTKFMAKE